MRDLLLDLTVSTTKGELALTDLQGKWTVFYFYPKDNTPGCTAESKDFASLQDEFSKCGANIFGISRDSLASHQKFKEKYGLNFELISDSDEKLCKIFDVIKQKSLFGKLGFGIERSTFLLNPQLELVNSWRKVKVNNHAEEVLEFLRENLR